MGNAGASVVDPDLVLLHDGAFGIDPLVVPGPGGPLQEDVPVADTRPVLSVPAEGELGVQREIEPVQEFGVARVFVIDDQHAHVPALVGKDGHVVELGAGAVPLVWRHDLLEIRPKGEIETLRQTDPPRGIGLRCPDLGPTQDMAAVGTMVVDVALAALVPEGGRKSVAGGHDHRIRVRLPVKPVGRPAHTDAVGVVFHEGHLVRALRVVIVIEDPDLGDVLGYDEQVVLAASLEIPEPEVGTPEPNPVPGGREAEIVGGFGAHVVPELVKPFFPVVDHVGVKDPVALPRPFRLEDGIFRRLAGDVDPTGHVLDPVDEPVVQKQLALRTHLPDRSLPLDLVETLRHDRCAQH